MKSRIKILVAAMGLLLSGRYLQAQQENNFTAQQAVEYTKKNSVQVKNVRP